MQSKKTQSRGHDPSAEDVAVTVEPTLKGITATGFVGGKVTVENPQTKRYDSREFGYHFSETWEGPGVTEEFVSAKVVAGTINGIQNLKRDYMERIEEERAVARAKKAAAELAAREAAEGVTVPPHANA